MSKLHFWAYQPNDNSLVLKKAPLPRLKKGELLIKNHVIGINPVDWKFIKANPLNWQQDHIPGVDGAGEIIAVGDDHNNHLIGCKVCYHCFLKENGSFASHTVVKADRVMTLPKQMNYSLAASLPCPMLTAYQAFEKIPLRAETSILIAGFGAVTKVLAQLLIKQGVHVDFISKHLNERLAQAMGIRHVFQEDTQINQKYFAAFDAKSEQNAMNLVKHLKANGHIICIQDRITTPIDPAFTRTISYHEIALGALHEFGDDADWKSLMKNAENILNLIAKNKITIENSREFSFIDMEKALAHSQKTREKTLVVI